MFFIDPAPAEDTTVIVAVDAYAMYWPVPSESFAKIIVPASSVKEEETQCRVSGDEEKPK
jgi:hypothetical protein